MRSRVKLAPAVLWLFAGAACEVDDVGKHCGTDPPPVTDDPIEGEVPVAEVVRVERDGNCESFQCLTHRGYPSYCTRTCRHRKVKDPLECETDVECDDGRLCYEGLCRRDNCPNGFECRTVQAIGPLAGQFFCVAKQGCDSHFDCEELGRVKCQQFHCVDVCLVEESCNYHQLRCYTPDELPCSESECQTPQGARIPIDNVEQSKACVLEHP